MSNKEKLAILEEQFGKPVGRLPDLLPGWNGPAGTLFWADSEKWNQYALINSTRVPFVYDGPYQHEHVPFNVPDGYSIFLADAM